MDYIEKHKKCLDNLFPLFSRMDSDVSLYHLEPYVMGVLGTNLTAKGVHNVTMNDPNVFGGKAYGVLASADQQVVVEGKGMTDNETTYIEDFVNAVLWEIDQKLINRGRPQLYPWNCFHSCFRGRLASRNLVRYERGEVIFEVSPWDTRYVSFGFSPKGLDFAGLEMNRYAQSIKEQYGIDIDKETGKVVDLWTPRENIRIIGAEEKSIKHDYGEVPCLYIKVPSGSMFMDENNEEHEGESIYASNREIYKQLNKCASILMTQTMLSFKPSLVYKAAGGPGSEAPDEDPTRPSGVTVIGNDEDLGVLVTPDMRNAARQLLALLKAAAQKGSLSDLDYGNLTFPLSSVAIAKLTESKDQIFVPRLQALSIYYQQLSKMMIRQYIKKGMIFELGEEGHRKSYDPEKLKGNYTIKFKYFSQSAEQKIANLTVARAAYDIGMSKKYVFTHINKLQNPEGVIMERMAEDVERFSPEVLLYRYIRSLYNKDDKASGIEADILKRKLITMIRSGGAPQPEPKKEQRTQDLVPLMDGGGGGRGLLGKENLEPDELFNREEGEREQMAGTNQARRMEGQVG